MQNILIDMCEKYHYDWLRNDRALGNRTSNTNKNPANANNKNKNKNTRRGRSRESACRRRHQFRGAKGAKFH